MPEFAIELAGSGDGTPDGTTAAASVGPGLTPVVPRRGVEAPQPMRRPRPRLGRHGGAGAGGGTEGLPPLSVMVMNRMGFGPRPGDLEAFEALGGDDGSRLEAYIEAQLHPESIEEPEVEERLRAAGFTTLGKSREALWREHHLGPDDGEPPTRDQRLQPFLETERATFLRAIHGRRQLASVLADFWHNHFNVFAFEHWVAPMWVEYDRDIIRAHSLGNFREMLEAVAKSFPMMLYLDGYGNTVFGPNENFARELFELHGLGAENYLGVLRQDEVAFDGERNPVGYVDDDVYESTRAFTGWGIDFATGEFTYYPARHDRFQKYVLGRFLRVDQPPMRDGQDVLDLVAFHPGTARHIARKLCRRLIADDPPQRVVEEAAAVFREERAAPDQLRRVVRTILRSPEFRSTWGRKVKRPFEFLVSCLRAVEAELSFAIGNQPLEHLISLYNQGAQPLFQWPTPDGYPDVAEKWMGSNAYVARWRVANWICDVKNWWDRSYRPFDPFAVIPPDVRSARELADFWIRRVLGRPMTSPLARQEAIDFMARGRDPETRWADFSDDALRERVWGLIALIMASPDFLVK